MSLPAHLEALLADLEPAAARTAARNRRDHRLRVAAAALAVMCVFAGAAFAATRLLGDPAPPDVQSELHAIARFVAQPGLKERTARVVATAPDATLYGVYDERGNYCVELVGARRGLVFGFSCGFAFGTRSAEGGAGGMGGAPQENVVVDGVVPPVVLFGKLADGAVSAEALLGDGREPVEIGLGGFFLYEPSEAMQPVARRQPIQISERDAGGNAVWQAYFAPPIALATSGRRVSGRLEIAGAVKLLVGPMPGAFPRPQPVDLGRDGSFSWVAPPDWDGLGTWTAVDRNGTELATAEAVPEEVWREILARARD